MQRVQPARRLRIGYVTAEHLGEFPRGERVERDHIAAGFVTL